MTFKRPGRGTSSSVSAAVGKICATLVMGAARLTLSLAMIIVVSGLVLFLRLTDGPVVLPGLNRYLVERANATSETIRVDVASLVLDLGDGSVPSGLEFHDVQVASPDGAQLFTIPRLRASFDFYDLMRGLVRPTRISVVSADAQFIRNLDGRIGFGLGSGDGVSLETADGAAATTDGRETLLKLINGIVGDAELAPEMSKLRVIEVLNARIAFTDRLAGGRMTARDATLRVRRDAGGATALLNVSGKGAAKGEIMRLVADRRAGAGITTVAGHFGQVDLKKLHSFLPALRVLDDIDTVAEGEISARFDADGRPISFTGRILAEQGTLSVDGETVAFDAATMGFKADMAKGLIEVTDALVSSPIGEGRASALIRLIQDRDGAVTAARAQVDVQEISLHGRALFDQPIWFDRGQIVAAWTPEGERIEIAESWLGRADLGIQFSGQVLLAESGLAADLRIGAESLDVRDLVRLWPRDAAANARRWINQNIRTGLLHDFTAEIRLRPGSELMAITAEFSNVTSSYIKGMSPIEDGAGEIFITLDEMHLAMRTASVKADGQTIALGGSSLLISDLMASETPADIRLKAAGATAAVLALIDQPPLELVRALGLDLRGVGGDAEVAARLKFPLLDALKVHDIEVDTQSVLRDTRLTLSLNGAQPVSVRADRLEVDANAEQMRLGGLASINGAPVTVSWREDYSKRPGRRKVRLVGKATPDLLRSVGMRDELLSDPVAVTLDLAQTGREPMTYDLDADLSEVSFRIAALDWSKPPGTGGRLTAKGRLGRELAIDQLGIEAPGLVANGTMAFWPDGRIKSALFERVVVPGRLDAGIQIDPGRDGVTDLRISGAMLDVSKILDGGGNGSDEAIRLRLDLGRLKVTESIVIRAAAGEITRARNGAASGRITGVLGPDAPVAIDLSIPAIGDGKITLRSPNAGAALRHADIYRGATGGELHVEARIPGGAEKGLSGQARILNVVVRSRSTFRNVLEDGGLRSAGEAVSGSGLSFRSVSIPFRYADGVVTVTDAIAVSPMLGLKMTGTLDENTEAVDLIGVLSPAYALTGALNEVPLLGQILSGGRGEGIVGMTFTLKGAMRDPNFSVNPLSLLAPGFLRKIFSGGGTVPSEEFIQNRQFDR